MDGPSSWQIFSRRSITSRTIQPSGLGSPVAGLMEARDSCHTRRYFGLWSAEQLPEFTDRICTTACVTCLIRGSCPHKKPIRFLQTILLRGGA